ncbi:hypothetical protein G6514_002069 [Epicoccum nigrum]|nr:hypothetical protein G6514_002069 [Epicoccum nigrum]
MPPTRRSTSSQSMRRTSSSSSSSTSTQSIAHADPDPGPENPLNLEHPKESNLTLSDFMDPRVQRTEESKPHWRHLATQLLAARNSFAARNPAADNPRCSAPDRSAVLAVYNEALRRVEHICKRDAQALDEEVTKKVETILDLRRAEAQDAVFYADSGAFLCPLEPQYAHPRLDYYDRGKGEGGDGDGYGRAAWMRLRVWRGEGWPRVVPERAVEREKRERERERRRRRLRRKVDEDLEGLERVVAGEWGEEVDADPERPWR